MILVTVYVVWLLQSVIYLNSSVYIAELALLPCKDGIFPVFFNRKTRLRRVDCIESEVCRHRVATVQCLWHYAD